MARNVEQVGIFVTTDTDDSGLKKVDAAADAATASLNAFSAAVAKVQHQTDGKSWLDANKLNPGAAKELALTASAIKRVADASKAMAQANAELGLAMPDKEAAKTADAFNQMALAATTLLTLSEDEAKDLVATATAMKTTADAANALAKGYNNAAVAAGKLRSMQSSDTARQEANELKLLALAETERHNKEAEGAAKARIANEAARLEFQKQQAAQRASASAADENTAALNRQERALESSRFAARELAQTYTLTAVALGVIPAASIAAFSTQERGFADVRRTTQLSYESLQSLRDAYTELSTEIPSTFNELSEIGTLGAQMNISKNDLGDYTKAVANFSTVTGMSVDEAAMGFGRLTTMLGGPTKLAVSENAGGFEQLASQVAELGARSVATEAEILNTAQSIATQAHSAGMAQDEILALSSTLASVKIPPEWARGSVQRVFNNFNAAVSEGGQDLDRFAAELGMSSDAVAKLWRDSPNEFFMRLATSIATTTDRVEQYQKIKDMGFTNVRDVEMIQRLANNMGLWNQQLRESGDAMEDSGFLNDSVAIIMDTLSAKFEAFKNAAQNAGAALGTGFGAPMKVVLSGLTAFLKAVADAPPLLLDIVGAALSVGTAFAAFNAAKAGALALAGSISNVTKRMAELNGTGKLTVTSVLDAYTRALTAGNAGAANSRIVAAAKNAETAAYKQSTAALVADNTIKKTASATNNTLSASEKALATSKQAGVAASREASAAAIMSGTVAVQSGTLAAAAGTLWKTFWASIGGPVGLAVFAGISVALGAITWGLEKFSDSSKTAADAASAFADNVGGYEAISSAMIQDTQELADGTQAANQQWGELTTGVNAAGKATNGADAVTRYYIDTQGNLVQANAEVAESLGYLTVKYGEHTRKLILDAALQSKSMESITGEQLQRLKAIGFDMGKYLEAGMQGKEAGNKYIDDLIAAAKARAAEVQEQISTEVAKRQNYGGPATDETRALLSQRNAIQDTINLLSGLKDGTNGASAAMDLAAAKTALASEGYSATGDAADDSTAALQENKDAWDDVSSAMQDYIDQAFGIVDAQANLDGALESLGKSIAENGNSLSSDSEAGRANLEAVKDFFSALSEQAIAGAQDLGITGQDAQVYIADMLQQGVDFLGSQGFDVSEVQNLAAQIINAMNFTVIPGLDPTQFTNSANSMKKVAFDTASYVQAVMASVQATTGNTLSKGNAAWGARYQAQGEALKAGAFSGLTSKQVASYNASSASVSRGSVSKGSFDPSAFFTGRNSGGSGGGGGRGGSGGGGGGGGGRGSKAAKDATKSAADEFKDFMSRLSSAMKDAMNSFWGTTLAQDSYHKSLNSMKKDIQDTKSKIADLRKENDKLTADMLDDQQKLHDAQFFNAIATKYGDTERMGSTQTDIGTAKADIADKQAQIAANNKEAQSLQAGMYALDGYSDAAIKNRAALYDLQQQMVGLIENYAQTGASTQQVQEYTNQLKAEFINQATQMGFNRTEVTKLSGGFDSLTKAIGNTPRRVNVNTTDNGSTAGVQRAINGLTGRNIGIGTYASNPWNPVDDVQRWANRTPVWLNLKSNTISVGTGAGKQFGLLGNKGGYIGTSGYIGGYAGGGLVPGSSPAARGVDNRLATGPRGLYGIRSGEYIVQQPAVDFYGRDFMNRLNTMQLPTINVSGGNGSGISTVQLMPNQLMQLARMVSSTVIVGNETVARASNAGNVAAGNRGVY